MRSLAQAHARQLSRYTRAERVLSRCIMRFARPHNLKDVGKLVAFYNSLRLFTSDQRRFSRV